MKKLDRWNKDVERGLDYILGLYENEKQKTETNEETKARHRKIAETADLTIELMEQCFSCGHHIKDTAKCKIRDVVVNCPDWVHLNGGNTE